MDTNVIVGLLTAAVILLSVVILALLAVMIIVLVKVKKVVNNINNITGNIAAATSWFTPAKLLHQVRTVFKR